MIKRSVAPILFLVGLILAGVTIQRPLWGSSSMVPPDTPTQITPTHLLAIPDGTYKRFQCEMVDNAQMYTFRIFFNGGSGALITAFGNSNCDEIKELYFGSGAYDWNVYATNSALESSTPSGKWTFFLYAP